MRLSRPTMDRTALAAPLRREGMAGPRLGLESTVASRYAAKKERARIAAAEDLRAMEDVLPTEKIAPRCPVHVAVTMAAIEMPLFCSKQGSARHRIERAAWKCPVEGCARVAASLRRHDEDDEGFSDSSIF